MTVSSTASVDIDINTICRRGMQLAGLLEPSQGTDDPTWAAKSAMARSFLETAMQGVQGMGLFQRDVEFYDITLTAGTTTYSLPASTLDVVGVAMFNLTGEDQQTAVQPMDRDAYFRLVDKTITGPPRQYFLHRLQTLTLYVYPVPTSADVGTLQIQRQYALATMSDGNKTIDLERYWIPYFVWALAHYMSVAAGLPVARCTYLSQQANGYLESARSASTAGNADSYFFNAHETGWSR